MKKDSYYFPHFTSARTDAKLIKLKRVLGMEGYGIYFHILETLREQTDFKYPILGIEDLAYEWHVSKEKIQAVITNYGLFEFDENNFWSIKLIQFLQPYLEKSQRARNAANQRWLNANADANALPEQCDSNASKVKESKVNKSKVKEINNMDTPSFKEIHKLIQEVEDKNMELLFDGVVKLKAKEYDQLVNEFGIEAVKLKTISLSSGIHNKLKMYTSYKDHYRVLLNWLSKDKKTQTPARKIHL